MAEPPAPHGRPGGSPPPEPLLWYRPSRLPGPPPRRWLTIRREHTIDALASLTVAALCFSAASRETLFRADWDFYSRLPLRSSTLFALLLNFVVVAAPVFFVVRAIRRIRRPLVRRVAAVASLATLLIAVNLARLTYESVGRWVDGIGLPGLVVLVIALAGIAIVRPNPALRAMRVAALVASPVAIVTVSYALWMFVEVAAGPVWRRVEPAPLKGPPPSLRRVVWLVFEELDQRLTFEARPADLELPELDRLRDESVYADAAKPPAGANDVSMPALITGRPVVSVVPLSPNDLELTFADGKIARWSTYQNLFARVRVFGYDTALIGSHLPYPRVLGTVLGAADWRPAVAYERARGETLGQALVNQWLCLAPASRTRQVSAERFAELGDLAIRAATEGRFGLVLLHLPVPQLPGIYDRTTRGLTTRGRAGPEAQYLDNLALVDRVVGELRRGLERARLGDRTWIVVSSDRWRRGAKGDDGQPDHRVPFLVRPPDGGRATHVDGAFSTLVTHDLILAILRGSLSDTTNTAAWLRRYPVTPPKDYTREGRPIY